MRVRRPRNEYSDWGGVHIVNVDATGYKLIARATSDSDSGWAWAPAWSPDGRRLAYTTMARLHTYDLASERSDRIAGRPGPWSIPHWSPDGEEIVFASSKGGLEMVRAGTGHSLISDGNFPAFSPDGNWIVYAKLGRVDELRIVRPDGSDDQAILGAPTGWSSRLTKSISG